MIRKKVESNRIYFIFKYVNYDVLKTSMLHMLSKCADSTPMHSSILEYLFIYSSYCKSRFFLFLLSRYNNVKKKKGRKLFIYIQKGFLLQN